MKCCCWCVLVVAGGVGTTGDQFIFVMVSINYRWYDGGAGGALISTHRYQSHIRGSLTYYVVGL